MSLAQLSDRAIVTTRIVEAPRELVFAAWTDPAHVAEWWGPDGFTTTIHEMDVRSGGAWTLTMHGPDGRDYKNESVFIEVVRPERIVYDHLSGPKFRMTATFEGHGDQTTVTMHMLFETAEQRDRTANQGVVKGGEQTLARLGGYLSRMSVLRQRVTTSQRAIADDGAASPWDQELVITRVFQAPRRLVFETWSTPEHLQHWWGPKAFTLPECRMDFRSGGAYRWVMQGPDGARYPMEGVFLDVTAPERIVFTATLEDEPPDHAIETSVTFVETEGKTTMTMRQRYFKVAASKTSGAPIGWGQSLDKLAQYLATLG